MIVIQLAGGTLDIKEDESLSLSWTSTRFANGLRDPYTNDFNIPKTRNNMTLLGTFGLIDTSSQVLGDAFAPATLTLDNGVPVSIRIQVVEVTADEIKICCYENTIPQEFMNSNVNDWINDGFSNTIYNWDKNSKTRYPDVFYSYNYGTTYRPNHAQYHPSKNLRDVVNIISSRAHYQLPVTINKFPIDYRLIATNKYVCPHNDRQVIEGVYTPLDSDTTEDMRRTLKIIGGQHVTNNMEGYKKESTDTELIYNRDCNVQATIYWSWQVPTAYGTYQVQMLRNGQTEQIFYIDVPTGQITNGVQQFSFNYSPHANDVFTFKITASINVFSKLAFMMDCRIINYYIYDEDYGIDLVYHGDTAKLPLYQYYSTSGQHEVNCWADEHTYTVYNNTDGTSTMSLTLPYRSLSYIGYWCNLPNLKVKEMVYSIGWMGGNKVSTVNGKMEYVTANKNSIIKGTITKLSPVSNYFGQTSSIQYTNDVNPIKFIYNNIWLEKNKVLHQNVFNYVAPIQVNSGGEPMGLINQYEISFDEEGNAEVEFENVPPTVMKVVAWSGVTYLAPPRRLSNMLFPSVTNIMQATIETNDISLSNNDFVTLDGHEYMVISGETNYKDNKTIVVGVLTNHPINNI